jgi:hypothetical protein
MTDTTTEALANLTHLSQKPGVLATLVLLRSTGSIVRSSGFPEPESSDEKSALRNDDEEEADMRRSRSTIEGDLKSAREVARAAYRFFRAAEEMQGEMCVGSVDDVAARRQEPGSTSTTRDEVKLLRMRMRRMEVVIVPGKSMWSMDSKRSTYL